MPEQTDKEIRHMIAELSTRRCCNCYHELPGYQVHGPGWHWIGGNVGPFCDDCWKEVTDWKDAERRLKDPSTRCQDCGTEVWPAPGTCPKCAGAMEWAVT